MLDISMGGTSRNASRPIVPEDLDRAVRAPTNPVARDRSASSETAVLSIFNSLLARPESFKESSYIFADDDIEKQGLKKAEDAYVEEFDEVSKTSRRHHICTLGNEPGIDSVLRGAKTVLMFWFSSYAGLYAYHDIVRIEHGKRNVSYFGRKDCLKYVSNQASQP